MKTKDIKRKCPLCDNVFFTERIDKKFCTMSCTYKYHYLKKKDSEVFKCDVEERALFYKVKSLEAKKC